MIFAAEALLHIKSVNKRTDLMYQTLNGKRSETGSCLLRVILSHS